MIRIITGVPGAGKTYLAMTEILKLCEYDSFFDEYRPREGTVIITNISDLKVQHVKFDEALEKMGYEVFFSEKNFEAIRKKYERVLIVIDECQKYFHAKTWNEKVAYAFQYHRHLGIDIILMTQDQRVLPRGLSSLPEYIVKARSRSINFGFRFVYDFYDSTTWTHLETKTLKKDQSVFRAYKSFKFDEKEKPKNVVVQWVVLTGGGVLILLVAVYFFISAFFPSGEAESSETVKAETTIPKVKDLIEKPPSQVEDPGPAPTERPEILDDKITWYSYPVTGFVNDRGVLLANGRYFPAMTDECTRNKIDFTLICPFLIELDGKEVYPSEIKRPETVVAQDAEAVYKSMENHFKDLNKPQEGIRYDSTPQKN